MATHEGETLPMNQQVYRIGVVLMVGVLLNKIMQLKDILQKNAFLLTDCSHMANLIPFILGRRAATDRE